MKELYTLTKIAANTCQLDESSAYVSVQYSTLYVVCYAQQPVGRLCKSNAIGFLCYVEWREIRLNDSARLS